MPELIHDGLSICRAAQAEGVGRLTTSLTKEFNRLKGVRLRGFEAKSGQRTLIPRIDIIRKQEVIDRFGANGLPLRQRRVAQIIASLQDRYPDAWKPTDTIAFDGIRQDCDDRGLQYVALIPDKQSQDMLNRERTFLWRCLAEITDVQITKIPELTFPMRIAAFTPEARDDAPNRVLEAAIGYLGVETRLDPIHCHPDPNQITAPSLQIFGNKP